ncbi:MAG: 1-phosphofructokinase family hexose kinase [Chitinophagaceae bacterium]|jgi:6-phosphofructokinase 2|nr:1-phosphofructokinase family hexose kinase [Chitinophagaceae bacterium]
MESVLTITLNPAIDKNFVVDRLVPDHKLRCDNPHVDPGGGGVNVARAIHRLGGQARALVLAGGRNGDHLRDLMTEQGVDTWYVDSGNDTRENLTISEKSSNKQYRLVLDGPTVSTEVQEALLAGLEALDPFPGIVVSSGSLPPGVPDDFFARIGAIVSQKKSKYILDTSGKALESGTGKGVYLLKPNLRELSILSGKEELVLDQVDDAADVLIKKGIAQVVVVSLGPAGAMLVHKDGYRHIPAPTVPKRSTVGAGDSMVAGMVHAMQLGLGLDDMAMMGVACGTAATMNEGTQLFKKEDAVRLFEWIRKQKSS